MSNFLSKSFCISYIFSFNIFIWFSEAVITAEYKFNLCADPADVKAYNFNNSLKIYKSSTLILVPNQPILDPKSRSQEWYWMEFVFQQICVIMISHWCSNHQLFWISIWKHSKVIPRICRSIELLIAFKYRSFAFLMWPIKK